MKSAIGPLSTFAETVVIELCQGFRTVSRLIPSVVQAACAAVR